MKFSGRELRDLLVAWLVLSVAFAVLLAGSGQALMSRPERVVGLLPLTLATAGIGFLLHELAHKVVAIRFGQIAEFRADYGMLFVALVSSLAGFLFAAPGAVHHHGYLTKREHGLVALAGPVTNLLLAAVFFVLLVFRLGFGVAEMGLGINLLLAGFNMIPFGPLDGRTVLSWSKVVFVVVFVPSIGLALLALRVAGFF